MRWLAALCMLTACDVVPSFSQEVINGTTLGAQFPRGFLFGAATSAHQVEGGLDNDWTRWELTPLPDGGARIANGDTSQTGAGSWTKWPDDLAALRQLGANAYRLGIEWSRLEPVEGAWNAEAEANYRAQLQALRDAGITPVVTVQHFTLPAWVAERGGWEWDGIPDALEAHSRQLGERFGDLVDTWCTINEPNIAAQFAYLWGEWPPGVQDVTRYTVAYTMMMRAHAKMARGLRAGDVRDADGDGAATFIGLTLNMNVLEPTTTSTVDVAVAALVDDAVIEMVPRALRTGRVRLSFPFLAEVDEEIPGLKESFDYFGVNPYSRLFVRFDLTADAFSRQYYMAGRPQSDLGFELYPEGVYRLLVRIGRYGWPMLILESGIVDNSGTKRPQYLRDHVYAMLEARKAGADIRGFFFWALVDNFEWSYGYSLGRTGLFRVDQSDFQLVRQPTAAVATFRQIAEEAGLVP